MNEYIDNLTKEGFTAFLLLHIANADLKITNAEIFQILQNIDEEEFWQVERAWTGFNDFECLQIIKEGCNRFYPDENGKEKLLAEITRIAMADDKFSVYEQNLIRSLKKIL